MKKLLITIAVSCVFFAATAFAGYHSASQVTVSGSYAYGTAQGAHNSSGNVQMLGCYVYVDNTPYTYANCYAENASGTYLGCTTTDPKMISLAQSVNYTSYISFGVSGSTCSSLSVENGSVYW